MSQGPLPVIVCGASGRMGKELIELCLTTTGIRLVGACTRGSSPLMGQDLGQSIHRTGSGVLITNSLEDALGKAPPSDRRPIVIDFSAREALFEHASSAEHLQLPFLVCVTGLQDDDLGHLKKVSATIPVLIAPNTSLGANLLAILSSISSQILKNADIEICETHHRHKKDSPSGTALFLANQIAQARSAKLKDVLCLNRHAGERREPGQIGVFGLRGGDELGTHTVHFFDEDDALELTHRVSNRRVFASGALEAARFLAEQPAGLYNMLDVFKIGRLLNEKA